VSGNRARRTAYGIGKIFDFSPDLSILDDSEKESPETNHGDADFPFF
jgi:hypothetical protein